MTPAGRVVQVAWRQRVSEAAVVRPRVSRGASAGAVPAVTVTVPVPVATVAVAVPAAAVSTVLPAVAAPAVAQVADELDDALEEADDRIWAAPAATADGVPVVLPTVVVVHVLVLAVVLVRFILVVGHQSFPFTVSR